MKFLGNLFLGLSLVSAGLVSNAQAQGRYYGYNNNDGYGRYSNDRYSNDRYAYGRSGNSLIGQILSDLDRAGNNARLDHHESKHFEEAFRKLQEFDERMARGRFDRGKLDKAIENLEHLSDADRVRGRDRDILRRDLYALRQYRSEGRHFDDSRTYRNDDDDRRYRPLWP